MNVTFDRPMMNNNYSVTITSSNVVDYGGFTTYVVTNKITNGFTIFAFNAGDDIYTK